MQNFRNLEIWNLSLELSSEIYLLTKNFPKTEIFGLTSQIQRASTSVFANIAEGAGRSTNADFARFINITIGSINEVQSYIYLSEKLGYIDNKTSSDFENKIILIKKKTIQFLKLLRTAN